MCGYTGDWLSQCWLTGKVICLFSIYYGIMMRQMIRFTMYVVYNETITFLVLSKLIIIHNGEKPSNCNQCDMRLDNHCMTHTSEKPYQYYLYYVSLCKIRNILFELLIVCSFNIILSVEMSLYCNICDMSLSKHIRMHTCEKPFQYKPHHVSICKIINIHISKIFSKYSIYRVSRCKYSTIHICKKPKQHSLYIIYCCNHILYIFKVLAIYLLSVVLFWSLRYAKQHMKHHTGEILFKGFLWYIKLSQFNYNEHYRRLQIRDGLPKCPLCGNECVKGFCVEQHGRYHMSEDPDISFIYVLKIFISIYLGIHVEIQLWVIYNISNHDRP